MKKYIILFILFPFLVKAESLNVTFDSCIDGDTAHFIYQDKNLKTRFLAIDAPEIEHEDSKAEFQGEEAKEFVCNILKEATNIQLEYDISYYSPQSLIMVAKISSISSISVLDPPIS